MKNSNITINAYLNRSSGAYHKKSTFSDEYLEIDATTVDEQFEQAIEFALAESIRYDVYNTFVSKLTLLPWHCYECRRPIDVDVSKMIKYNDSIDDEEFLCDKHKHDTVISVKSVPYMKYKSLFIQHFSNTLLSNITTQNSEEWQKIHNILNIQFASE